MDVHCACDLLLDRVWQLKHIITHTTNKRHANT